MKHGEMGFHHHYWYKQHQAWLITQNYLVKNTNNIIQHEPIRANLSGRDFQNLNLAHADLRFAILTETNFRSAILVSADLKGAILTGADLSNTCLQNTNLCEALLNEVQGLTHIPKVDEIDKKVLDKLLTSQNPDWSNSRGGIAVRLTGNEVILEGCYSQITAAALVYAVSRPTKAIPDFLLSGEQEILSLTRDLT